MLEPILKPLAKLVVTGGADADTLTGGAEADILSGGGGNDRLFGHDGDDTVTGGIGADKAWLGTGNDLFVWAAGDGNDLVDGEAGLDTLDFSGASAGEIVTVAALAKQVTIDRDVDDVHLGLAGIEGVTLRTFGGADRVTVGDLSGSGLSHLLIDLGFGTFSGQGDGQLDRLDLAGSGVADKVSLVGGVASGGVTVSGLPALVQLVGIDPADLLAIDLGLGNDQLDARNLGDGITLHIEGGAGVDILTGGDGDDLLSGGADTDVVTGGRGDDTALLGTGNDRFLWAAGDGNDVVEGGDGADRIEITAAASADTILFKADGARTAITIDGARIDADDVERAVVRAGGGDTVIVGDLTGADLTSILLDLAAGGGADTLSIFGRAATDVIKLTGSGGTVALRGLPTAVDVAGAEPGDLLRVQTGDGKDTIDASGLTGIRLLLDGGLLADKLTGSQGADTILGGDGNDTVAGGRGDDIVDLGKDDDRFVYAVGDGDDTVAAGSGTDVLEVRGTDQAVEIMTFQRFNGGIGTFDAQGTGAETTGFEKLSYLAGGGFDEVRVRDLTGTGITDVTIDLAGKAGDKTGDGEIDQVELNGTGASDFVEIRAVAGGFETSGLGTHVTVLHSDGFDRVTLTGGEGEDFLLVTTPKAGAAQFILSGDSGADTLFGGVGNDSLFGGTGNDRLDGGKGQDILFGGTGADRFTYTQIADSAALIDVIKDFSHAEGDHIDLSAIDADPTRDGDQAFRFLDTAAFDGGKGAVRIEYSGSLALVFVDVNGDKKADMEVAVTVIDAGHALQATDFIL